MFADLIRRFLLANPHRLSVTFAASREAAREQQEAEARALARAAAQRPAGSKAARDLVADCSDLALWQTTPDTPEAVAAVPTLSFKDVSREVPTWVVEPRTEEPYRGTTLMEAEEEMTGELIYAALALDLGQSVPPEDIVLLPVLAFAMDLLGFRGGTALERQRKEFTHCAGIQYLLEVGSREGEEDLPAFHLIIEGGAKSAEAPLLLSLLRRALLDVDFRSAEAAAAVRSYVTSAITGMQRDFQDNALEWVRCHTAAMMTPVGWIRAQLEVRSPEERWQGCRGWDTPRMEMKNLFCGEGGNRPEHGDDAQGRTIQVFYLPALAS